MALPLQIGTSVGHCDNNRAENLLTEAPKEVWAAPRGLDPSKVWVIFDAKTCVVVDSIAIFNTDGDYAVKECTLQVATSAEGPWTNALAFTASKSSENQRFAGVKGSGRFWKLLVHSNHGCKTKPANTTVAIGHVALFGAPVAEPPVQATAISSPVASSTATGSLAATPSSSDSAAVARLLDGGNEPTESRLPLLGFATTPVLTLEEAGAKCTSQVLDLTTMIIACKSLIQNRKGEGKIPKDVSDDGACALALYSAGWPDPLDSFYYILNALLRAADRSGVKPFYAMLRLMVEAMAALPRFVGTLFRGVKDDVTHKYPTGKHIVWWAFSSCTNNIEVLQNDMFLGKLGKRTLFVIEGAVGFDIRAFSFFQNESEVLLPAGSEVIVKNHLDAGNGLKIITLQMIQTTHCVIDLNTHLQVVTESGAESTTVCPVEGLAEVLKQAKITSDTCQRIMTWCQDQEAAELQEVLEIFDELSSACDLQALPKKRFLANLKKALGEDA